jgi:acetyl esterase/lipase
MMRTIRYGDSNDQQADLHRPDAAGPPVVCLLHGGFWRMPPGRDQMDAVAGDLVARGFAVWNIEYRRLGASGGGWPGTLDDVRAGIDHLAKVRAEGIDIDLGCVIVVGHSAGGHLALWSAALGDARVPPSPFVRVRAAVGVAPIADLAAAYEGRVGGEVVAEFLGGTPSEHPDRLRAASPLAMLPLRVPHLIIHGSDDTAVPLELSRRYIRAARAAGDEAELIELSGTGHMEFLDPGSEAHATLCRRLPAFL